MKIIVDIINQTSTNINIEEINEFAEIIAKKEQLSGQLQITLLLVQSDYMKEMNYKWRGRNKATDVLAFPFEFSESGFLGDIIIDIETANRQKGNKSLIYEIKTLFLHGFLHLLGYDHLSSGDADIMQTKELEYRKNIKE